MSFFSWLWVSGITITLRKPSALPTRARPMPVLPAVPSTMTPPSRSRPLLTASSMMYSAARSFTDWPGFMNSALPRMVQPVSSDARLSLMRGVLPMESIRSLRISMTRTPAAWVAWTVTEPRRPDKDRSIAFEDRFSLGDERLVGAGEILGLHADGLGLRLGIDRL